MNSLNVCVFICMPMLCVCMIFLVCVTACIHTSHINVCLILHFSSSGVEILTIDICSIGLLRLRISCVIKCGVNISFMIIFHSTHFYISPCIINACKVRSPSYKCFVGLYFAQ